MSVYRVSGSRCVSRGGGWFRDPKFVWVADCHYYAPNSCYEDLGVRLVRRCL